MEYRYELHAHSSVGSACGRAEPEDYVSFYLERGYAGMVLTDHFFYGNCAIDRSLPWKEFISRFAQGYLRLKEAADKRDFTVFFGFEQRFIDGMDEYLILGLSPEWMAEHPELRDLPREEFFDLVHGGDGFVIQAHPHRFRPAYMTDITLTPGKIDAAEVYNACNPIEHNRQGLEYAKNLGIPQVGGSDIHAIGMDVLSGIALPYPVKTEKELIDAIRTRAHTILPKGTSETLEASPLLPPDAPVYVCDQGNLIPADIDPFCAAWKRRQQ